MHGGSLQTRSCGFVDMSRELAGMNRHALVGSLNGMACIVVLTCVLCQKRGVRGKWVWRNFRACTCFKFEFSL